VPPAAWIASTTRRQAAFCRSVWCADAFARVVLCGEMWQPSVMIRPAEARWA
jgi:hypothetical protein